MSTAAPKLKNSEKNKLDSSDRAYHDWYRFVLSYPPHLVRQYLEEFNLTPNDLVLDPFCGTGTTLVEAKLASIPSIGIEANKFVNFASATKTDWHIDAGELAQIADQIAADALRELERQGVSDEPFFDEVGQEPVLRELTEEHVKLILKDSISPLPLHKVLQLLDNINTHRDSPYHKYLILALGNVLVYEISNLRFGPEVGVGKLKTDTPVVKVWHNQMKRMCADLKLNRDKVHVSSEVVFNDMEKLRAHLGDRRVSAIITSPPYPNEKDYTRTTRLESVLLGFINTKQELREVKKTLLRSNTRGVYKGDDDDKYVEQFQSIQDIANAIEAKRIELGKTSGFEKLYSTVTKLYFGGMAKHLMELRTILRPGAHLAYVVGDQASYLRVMIPTGKLIGEIAESLGYELVRIDLFRTRFSTATSSDLNEEVVVLRWRG